MHLLRSLLPVSLLVAVACGPGDPSDVCGQSGVIPTPDEAPNGFATATLDGQRWREAGSWAAGPNASLDLGTLSMIIAADETGTATSDLVARRAFPICVPLGARSETSGNVSFDGSYVSDESHTGGLAILGEEDGFLAGRFAVDLQSPSSGNEVSFEEGAFRVERR